MKAITEIGFRKSFKFAAYCLLTVIYHYLIDHLLYFPQARRLFLVILGAKIGSDTVVMNVKFFNIKVLRNENLVIRIDHVRTGLVNFRGGVELKVVGC